MQTKKKEDRRVELVRVLYQNLSMDTDVQGKLVCALLEALEDAYPEAVGDWVWERGQEMGLVNPEVHP